MIITFLGYIGIVGLLATGNQELSFALAGFSLVLAAYCVYVAVRLGKHTVIDLKKDIPDRDSTVVGLPENGRIHESGMARRATNERLLKEITERKRVESMLLKSNEQMQADLNLAAEFQHTVLPKFHDVPYLKMALRYLPYGKCSGDVYDFLLNREGDLSVFLGDATGHGVAAAFMTMMVHLGLDSIRRDLPANEVIRRLNSLLASRETGKSITGVYFRVTPEGRLTVTHAGHPSLMVFPYAATHGFIFREGGCPLGMFREEPLPYVEEAYQLAHGDKIFAYTDAVIEWQNSNQEQFGMQRLMTFLEEHKKMDLDKILETLLAELNRFAKGHGCEDDLTMLCFEFKGSS
ncbi:MAG: serine/threonine-protein phosphatase [Gammaproteobacteria bacterium]|nr:serine/threonine-protein phosphatase [Gammaproteobacteria bacterium]MCI0590536.1 serine/threonine-protein phosphatase [Gammaproteobacteria bacterium]